MLLWCHIFHSFMMSYIPQFYDVIYSTVLWCQIFHSFMMSYIPQFYAKVITLLIVKGNLVICSLIKWNPPSTITYLSIARRYFFCLSILRHSISRHCLSSFLCSTSSFVLLSINYNIKCYNTSLSTRISRGIIPLFQLEYQEVK